MLELMESESQGIALSAAKYVLDSTGYKPTDKVDLTTEGSITVNIVGDE